MLWDVTEGDDFYHPFEGLRLTCVYRSDNTAGNGSMQYFRSETMLRDQIIGKFGSSGYLLVSIHSFYALTNSSHRQSPSEYKIPERSLTTFYVKECCQRRPGHDLLIVNKLYQIPYNVSTKVSLRIKEGKRYL